MVTDVALIIRKILLESGNVYLPGYGTFIIKRTPASYHNIQNRIEPPSNELLFIAEQKDDIGLLQYIQQYYKLETKEASRLISDFTDTITSSLTNENSNVEIEGLGVFKLKDNEVNFEGNQNLSNWFTNGLLPVIPQLAIKDSILEIADHNKVSERDHTWRWLPFIFLLCILTFLLKYHADYKPASSINQVKKEQITNTDSEQNTENVVDTIEEDITTYCIIITGYFTEAKNILKMVDRIEELGYEVFMEDIVDGTRVGIRIDCTKMDLRQKIYDIRDTISSQAWYLEPPIKID